MNDVELVDKRFQITFTREDEDERLKQPFYCVRLLTEDGGYDLAEGWSSGSFLEAFESAIKHL